MQEKERHEPNFFKKQKQDALFMRISIFRIKNTCVIKSHG